MADVDGEVSEDGVLGELIFCFRGSNNIALEYDLHILSLFFHFFVKCGVTLTLFHLFAAV